MTKMYGGIEAGGTKFVCAVGTGPDDIRAMERFPTVKPDETIREATNFLLEQQELHGRLSAVGIAAFGPVDLHLDTPTYGFITTTPKPDWSYTDIAGPVQKTLGVPVGFDTDVNGAALGEWTWGAARGLENFLYLTIGTGIGAGGMVNGGLVHGLVHPEMGHMLIPHDHQRDPFIGNCPYHRDCLEGLANGPAIEKRWGIKAEFLEDDHPAWELEAEYLGLALANLVCILSPERVIMGGGVMEKKHLFPMIRRRVQQILNGYVQAPAVLEKMDAYIVPPGLGNRAGLLGAIALAIQAESALHQNR
jgi:fructokinase